ncbi:MAG: DUF1127 domain-containing protein [Devosia sp.]
MFCKSKSRLPVAARRELSHLDAHLLRDMGFNPDFRDAFEGRRSSLLFQPFRHPRRD